MTDVAERAGGQKVDRDSGEGVEAPSLASAPGSPSRRVFVACCGGSLAFSAWFIWRASFRMGGARAWVLFDDAMISMRYAHNLARGDGLVWNPSGPRVEGFTNPLWTLWMAVLHLLPVGPLRQSLLVMVSSALLLLAVIWVARRLAVEVAPDEPALADVATVVTATFFPLIYWSLAGMEVGLLALLIGVVALYGVRLLQRPGDWRRRDTIGLGVASVAAIATRLDAVLAVAVVVGFCVARAEAGKRRAWLLRLGTAPLAGLAVMTAARRLYYGDWLPNTYYLKATGIPLGLRLSTGTRQLLIVMIAHLAVLALTAAIGWRAGRGPTWWLLAGLAGAQVAYSVWVGGDAWEHLLFANRYLTVATVPAAVLAARGVLAMARSPRRLLPGWCAAVAVMAVALAVLAPSPTSTGNLASALLWQEARDQRIVYLVIAVGLVALALELRHRARPALVVATALVVVLTNARAFNLWRTSPDLEMRRDLARDGWALRDATRPDTSVAVWLAGADPYFSDRPAVDFLGKSDRHIAKLPAVKTGTFQPGHNKLDFTWSLDTYRPDLVRLSWPSTEMEHQLTSRGYQSITAVLWVRTASLGKVDVDALRASQR